MRRRCGCVCWGVGGGSVRSSSPFSYLWQCLNLLDELPVASDLCLYCLPRTVGPNT